MKTTILSLAAIMVWWSPALSATEDPLAILHRHSMALGQAQEDLAAFARAQPRSADYTATIDLLGVIHHARAVIAEVSDLVAVLNAVPCDKTAPTALVARLISDPIRVQLENDVNHTNVSLNHLDDSRVKDAAVRIRSELRAVLSVLDQHWPAR